jgi:hypothetical protein
MKRKFRDASRVFWSIRHGGINIRACILAQTTTGDIHGMSDQKIKRTGTSSVAALVISQTAHRSAERDNDAELMDYAKELESRALAAIKLHLPELTPKEKIAGGLTLQA